MTQAPSPTQRRMTPEAWVLLSLIALFWGGSFAATRAALVDVPVATLVAFRVGGGALALWIYIALARIPVGGGWRAILVFAFMGVMNNVIPWSLIAWGQLHIASGLAAILNASTAIFTVCLAALLFHDERMTPAKMVGVLLGFAGVVTVMGTDALRSLDLTSLGQLAIILASICYAFASTFGRHFATGQPPEVAAAGMLTVSSLIMVPLALAHDGVPDFAAWHPATFVALGYHGLVSSALAFLCFYRLLRVAGAGNASLVTLMIAPVSVVIGSVLFGESLTAADYAGFLLLALGLLVIDGRVRVPGKNSRELSDGRG